MTHRINILGPNLRDQSRGQFVVHAAGCRDIAKVKDLDGGPAEGWEIDVRDRRDAVEAVYADHMEESPDVPFTSYAADFHFAPCVNLLPDAAPDAPKEKECPECGQTPMGAGCYHICPNSDAFYSREREMADEAFYGQDDVSERYAAERLDSEEVK